ncbi:hypothetical protein TcCL_ESM04221 [Trypanosoma cruzi]|nr:hypothetical protein TcCL_ESM04221 [Trypanosoma cruzi]
MQPERLCASSPRSISCGCCRSVEASAAVARHILCEFRRECLLEGVAPPLLPPFRVCGRGGKKKATDSLEVKCGGQITFCGWPNSPDGSGQIFSGNSYEVRRLISNGVWENERETIHTVLITVHPEGHSDVRMRAVCILALREDQGKSYWK